MQQISFAFIHDEDLLRSYLEKASEKTVSLVITDNSHSMLALKVEEASVKLRLHRMFLSAGSEVRDEIACFIRNSAISTPLIRRFIDEQSFRLTGRFNPGAALRHQGRHYNLLDAFNTINREYFGERVTASITWGSKRARQRARSRTLGCYYYNSNTIRINPALDSPRCPYYYLEYIIYHEMLHADIGLDGSPGRRSYHSGIFRDRERLFRHYDRVIKLERRGL